MTQVLQYRSAETVDPARFWRRVAIVAMVWAAVATLIAAFFFLVTAGSNHYFWSDFYKSYITTSR